MLAVRDWESNNTWKQKKASVIFFAYYTLKNKSSGVTDMQSLPVIDKAEAGTSLSEPLAMLQLLWSRAVREHPDTAECGQRMWRSMSRCIWVLSYKKEVTPTSSIADARAIHDTLRKEEDFLWSSLQWQLPCAVSVPVTRSRSPPVLQAVTPAHTAAYGSSWVLGVCLWVCS